MESVMETELSLLSKLPHPKRFEILLVKLTYAIVINFSCSCNPILTIDQGRATIFVRGPRYAEICVPRAEFQPKRVIQS